MGSWWLVGELTANPEQDGAPIWGWINSDRVTAVVITMIHNPATGYDRDVWYPEVISPDLGTKRMMLNGVSTGFLSYSDCFSFIKGYVGGRDD